MEKNLNVSLISFNAIHFLETMFSITDLEKCNMIKNQIAVCLEYARNSKYYYNKEKEDIINIFVINNDLMSTELFYLKKTNPFNKINKKNQRDLFTENCLKCSEIEIIDFKPILKSNFHWNSFIENIKSQSILLYLFMETNNLSIDDIYNMLQEAIENKGVSKTLKSLKEKILSNFTNLGKVDQFLNKLDFDLCLNHLWSITKEVEDSDLELVEIFPFLNNKIKGVLDIYEPDISTIEGLMSIYESCKLLLQNINNGNNLYLFNNSMMLILEVSLDSSADLDVRSKAKELYTKLECLKTSKVLETNLEILTKLNKS